MLPLVERHEQHPPRISEHGEGDEFKTAVGDVSCSVIDWCVPIPHGTITICGIHSPEALEPDAPDAEWMELCDEPAAGRCGGRRARRDARTFVKPISF